MQTSEYEGRKKTALRLLKSMAEAPGVSGYEAAVRRVFRRELKGEAATDKTGSVFITKIGTNRTPRIMMAAHMDEVGFVVRSITAGGLIRFMPLGSWWAHTVLAKRVKVITREGSEILGVVGAKPPHFLAEAERERVMKIDEMYIDVGAADSREVEDRFGIRVGDVVVPDSSFTPMHNPDLLLCKAFDDRAGMALLVQAAFMLEETEHPNTVCVVGTVQEEVGTRGAQTAAFAVNPDAAVIFEGTPADDVPGIGEDEPQGRLQGGVQVRLMDPSAIMNRKFADFAIGLAQKHGIKHQVAVRKSGGTDARAIHLSREGVPVIVLGIPTRYAHTHNCIIHIDDYLSTLELAMKILEHLDGELVRSFTAFDD